MNNILLLFTMIFSHIIDDYCLQGILASMKQKAWWKIQEQYNDKYKYDYIMALAMHSFSWAFMIMCPILFTMPQQVRASFIIAFIVNVIIHAVADDLKANKLKINLVQDQLIHLAQIVVTWFVIIVLGI